MRQIKFRAKRADNGEWVYGDLLRPITGARIVNYDESDSGSVKRADYSYFDVDENTIGQFTGLTDRSGKEIYEDDIIVVNGKYERVVLWDEMSWALMPCELYHDKTFWRMNIQHPGMDWWKLFADVIEVISNIDDNPGLLNEE